MKAVAAPILHRIGTQVVTLLKRNDSVPRVARVLPPGILLVQRDIVVIDNLSESSLVVPERARHPVAVIHPAHFAVGEVTGVAEIREGRVHDRRFACLNGRRERIKPLRQKERNAG